MSLRKKIENQALEKTRVEMGKYGKTGDVSALGKARRYMEIRRWSAGQYDNDTFSYDLQLTRMENRAGLKPTYRLTPKMYRGGIRPALVEGLQNNGERVIALSKSDNYGIMTLQTETPLGEDTLIAMNPYFGVDRTAEPVSV